MMCPILILVLSDFSPTSGRTMKEENKEQRSELNKTSVLGIKKRIWNLIKEAEERSQRTNQVSSI